MEETPLTNEKPLFQIASRVSLGLMLVLFMIGFIINGDFLLIDLDAIGGIALACVFVGALGIPFGMIGGKIGKGWLKTQSAIWIGAIIGATLGSILMSMFLIFIFLSLFGFSQ